MKGNRTRIGNVYFDRVTTQAALARIAAQIRSRKGGYVVTPNVDHIVIVEKNAHLQQIYHDAFLSLADGQPLQWMSRLLDEPLPEKISGSDFAYPLMQMAAEAGLRVFLFGATPDTSAKAAKNLLKRYPNLLIVGRDSSPWNPSIGASEDEPLVTRIRNSGADIVVVALGCPKQEIWMSRHAQNLAPAVLVGLGGTLDFLAGSIRRAPQWVSSIGAEWLYRLAQEPRRLAYRYLVRDMSIMPLFIANLYRRVWAS